MSPVAEPIYASSSQGNTNKKQSGKEIENKISRSKVVQSGSHGGFKQERTHNDHESTETLAKMTTVSASSTRSDPSEIKFDCSSCEILTHSDQHNNYRRSPEYDAATPRVNENKNRTGNSMPLSMSSSGLKLDDSGTEADNEGRVGPGFGRKDGRRGIRRKNKEVPIGDDYQVGSTRTDHEVLRILIEAGILLGVYFLSYQSSAIWEERRWRQKVSLLCHACMVSLFVANYALRCFLFYLRPSLFMESRNSRRFFRPLSSYCDSASALYPPMLPVIVAMSLLPKFQEVFIANCILGLSALPVEVIHLFSYSSSSSVWFSSVSLYIIDQCHWLISITPLIILQLLDGISYPQHSYCSQTFSIDAHMPIENLILLYPLHLSLTSILHYLTSTSLLPAERQLLSISLINLYIFSENPPTVILKAVIWIGGLGIMVTCRPVVRSNYQPSQAKKLKFYQKRNRTEANPGIWKSLKDLFRRAVRHHDMDASDMHYNESDADEDGIYKQTDFIDNEFKAVRGDSNENCILPHAGTQTSTDSVNVLGYRIPLEVNETEIKRETLLAHAEERAAMTKDGGKWLNIYASIKSDKELHAAYVYIMIFVIIIWPFRLYISKRALHGYEAIGWVIGYLFKDVPYFRDWIESSGLEFWIPVSSLFSQLYFAVGQARSKYLIEPGNFRLLFICYWILILALGLRLILNLPPTVSVDTRRKIFHGMMVLILVPTTPVDPAFISLALSVVLALFLLLEFLRISGLPPLSKPLAVFLAPYVDGRDVSGPIVISHIFLLLGCAIPVWLSLAAASLADILVTGSSPTIALPWQGWNLRPSLSASSAGTDLLSGVICVGLGDAAASLVGRRYGRTKWPWPPGSKSIEGSTAFTIALFTGLALVKIWLYFLGWGQYSVGRDFSWLPTWSGLHFLKVTSKIATASCVTSLTEAVLMGGNDNIVVPVILWAIVRGLGL